MRQNVVGYLIDSIVEIEVFLAKIVAYPIAYVLGTAFFLVGIVGPVAVAEKVYKYLYQKTKFKTIGVVVGIIVAVILIDFSLRTLTYTAALLINVEKDIRNHNSENFY